LKTEKKFSLFKTAATTKKKLFLFFYFFSERPRPRGRQTASVGEGRGEGGEGRECVHADVRTVNFTVGHPFRHPWPQPAMAGCPKLTHCKKKKNSPYLTFWFMWSTLASWLHHMLTLLTLLLNSSNIQNFLSIGSKNTIFVLLRSLLQDASLQKVSKNLKIV
jgi:hypothetical protein